MASRVISIKVVYENREALVAARAQAVANKAVADAAKASAMAAQKLATEEQKTAKASAQAALAQQKLAASMQQSKEKADSHSRSFGSLIAYTAKLYVSFQLVSKATNLVTNEISSAFSSAYEMQKSLTLLGAAGNLTGEGMASIRQAIHQLATEIPVSQEEISKGALELTRMGYTGQDLENVLGSVSKAALVMGTSVADAGEAVFTASNVFGFTSSQAEEVAAKLVYAANASALSLTQVGVSLNYTAGTAKTAGADLETVLAMMATLKNLGIGASTIGTSLRTFFRELSVGGKAAKAIGGDIKSLGLEETFKRFKELDPTKFPDLFTKQASSALQLFQAELQKTGNQYETFLTQLTGGGAETDFKTVLERFGKDLPGSVQLFKNSLTELADSILAGPIGESFGTLLRFLAKTNADMALETAVNKEWARQYNKNKLPDGTSPGTQDIETIRRRIEADFKFKQDTRGQLSREDAATLDAKEAEEAKKLADALAGNKKDSVKKALEDLIADYKKWQEQIENMELHGHAQDVELTKKKLLEYATQFEKMGDLGSANSALREYNSLLKDQAKELTAVHKAALAVGKAAGDKTEMAWAEALKRANMDLRTTTLQIEGLGEAITGKEWGKIGDLETSLDSLSKLYYILGQDDKVEKINQLKTALEDLKNSSGLYAPDWKTRFVEMATGIDMATLAVNNLNGAVDALSSKLGNDLVSSIAGVKTAYVEWGEIGKQIAVSLIVDLIKLSIRFAILQLIAAANPAAGSFLAFAGNQLGGKFASGGTKTVRQPTNLLVGEAGKETVTVTPRSRVNRDNGGSSIVVNINGDVYGAEKFNEAVAIANKRKSYV